MIVPDLADNVTCPLMYTDVHPEGIMGDECYTAYWFWCAVKFNASLDVNNIHGRCGATRHGGGPMSPTTLLALLLLSLSAMFFDVYPDVGR